MPRKNRKAMYPQKAAACHQESQAIEEHLLQLGVAQFLESFEHCRCEDQCAVLYVDAELLEDQKRNRSHK